MHDTIFNKQIQYMGFSDDYSDSSLYKLSKNMKIILQECGLWKQDMMSYDQKSDSMKTDCCMRHILENQSIKNVDYKK